MPLKGLRAPIAKLLLLLPSHKPLALLRKCHADLLRDGNQAGPSLRRVSEALATLGPAARSSVMNGDDRKRGMPHVRMRRCKDILSARRVERRRR
jgi:hypothetical protein